MDTEPSFEMLSRGDGKTKEACYACKIFHYEMACTCKHHQPEKADDGALNTAIRTFVNYFEPVERPCPDTDNDSYEAECTDVFLVEFVPEHRFSLRVLLVRLISGRV